MVSHPGSVRRILRDTLGRLEPIEPDGRHLEEAMRWLCRAHDASGGGVSAGYHPPDGGWLPPYPETTGYIIPTFLRFGEESGHQDYLDRAHRMGDWEIDLQLADGSVRGGIGVNEQPVVFNAGQVILGWVALYHHSQSSRYLDAAIRAAAWLVSVQDGDGGWRTGTFRNSARAYHTRVAWPLLNLYRITNDETLLEAGRWNVLWALSGAHENGWLEHMAFVDGEPVLSHTIAYTYRGLLESAMHLPDQRTQVLEVVHRAMGELLMRYERRKNSPGDVPKPLAANIDESWRFTSAYSCPTGTAQTAIIWLKLYSLEGDARFLNGALRMLDQLKSIQSLDSGNPAIRGAIAGAYPCWGKYNPYSYPNWAAKFFADALMLQEQTMLSIEAVDS